MSDLILPRKREHPEWTKIGEVAVDSGCIHIGDLDCGLYLEVGENWTSDGHSTTIHTLFGDGVYDVLAQINADGSVERVMVEFGSWEP
jgi:hypothetical protein